MTDLWEILAQAVQEGELSWTANDRIKEGVVKRCADCKKVNRLREALEAVVSALRLIPKAAADWESTLSERLQQTAMNAYDIASKALAETGEEKP